MLNEKVEMIWPHRLYAFATCCDWLLLALACAFALVAGLCLPALLWCWAGALDQVGADGVLTIESRR